MFRDHILERCDAHPKTMRSRPNLVRQDTPLFPRNELSILYKNVIIDRNRSVMKEIPVNTAAAIGAAHFFVIPEAEADDSGAITVISDEGRFAQDLQGRIEAESKFAEHAGVATCGRKLL